jgi:hypothetical protein
MSKKLGFALAAAVVPTLACTALLGSFEVGGATPLGAEGGADAANEATGGEAGATEGGGEAGGDASVPLFKCSLDDKNAHKLDSGPLTQLVFAYSINNMQTRVIASKVGVGVQAYTYDRNGGGTPQITPLTKVGQVLSVRRLANGIGILSLDTAASPATGTSIGVWIIDDATGSANRTTFRLVNGGTSQATGAFVTLGTDYLYAYGDGNGSIEAARFVAGGGPPTPMTIASGVTGGAGNVRTVEVANGKMYVFNDVGPDPSNGNASAGYYVVDAAVTTSNGVTTLGSGVTGKASFAIATDSALGNFQVASVELDLANGTPPAVLHAGSVPAGKGSKFNVLDIPTALTFTTLVDAPFGDHASSRFEGTDFIALGPNPNKDPGLDFVWFDTKIGALRAVNGDATKLLATHSVSGVAAVLTQSTGIFANFDVVWNENATQNNDPTAQGVMYSAQMNCIK